jgi:hypothetical protein
MPFKYGKHAYGDELYSYLEPLVFEGSFTIPWAFSVNLSTAGNRDFTGSIVIPWTTYNNFTIVCHFGGDFSFDIDLAGAGLSIYIGPFWKPDELPDGEFWVPIVPGGEFWIPDIPVKQFWVPIPEERGWHG